MRKRGFPAGPLERAQEGKRANLVIQASSFGLEGLACRVAKAPLVFILHSLSIESRHTIAAQHPASLVLRQAAASLSASYPLTRIPRNRTESVCDNPVDSCFILLRAKSRRSLLNRTVLTQRARRATDVSIGSINDSPSLQ